MDNINLIDKPINNFPRNINTIEKSHSLVTNKNIIIKIFESITTNNNYKYSIKIFFILFIFAVINIEIKTPQIDLNNYLDKVYGEEDLLSIIKEKEKEMIFTFGSKRKRIKSEIEDIYNIIEKIKEKKQKFINSNKKIIREDGKLILDCSYSLNNGYILQTLVAMTSLVKNAGNNTFYNIYLLISPDFTEENKEIMMSVEKHNKDHCKIIMINMGNSYINYDTNTRIPTASYYRLSLHNLLPNVDRILHMDGDTAVFQDLSELITLDMKGNYILGYLDSARSDLLEKYGKKNSIILCAGVLLMDLSGLRQNNYTAKFKEFLDKNIGNIDQHDQTTINVVCQEKISILPPKYGLWNFQNKYDFRRHNNLQKSRISFNEKEASMAYEHPSILHYVKAKPFHRHTNKYYFKEWWKYAKETDYYDEIYKYYKTVNC